MNEKRMNHVGELIMRCMKDEDHISDVNKMVETPVAGTYAKKYDDKPLFARENPRESVGYVKKPDIPWCDRVLPKIKYVSPRESPIKEWWKSNQLKTRDEKE